MVNKDNNKDTKSKILDVAEKLFATKGIASSSIRDIVSEANVNIAAVNYHFGSRDRLVVEVYRRRLEPLNNRRIARLDSLESKYNNQAIPIKEIISALIEPVFDLFSTGEDIPAHLCVLMGRAHSETNVELRKLIGNQFSEIAERFLKAFSRVLPNLSKKQLAYRMLFMVGSMAYSLMEVAGPENMTAVMESPEKREGIKEELISFLSIAMKGEDCE